VLGRVAVAVEHEAGRALAGKRRATGSPNHGKSGPVLLVFGSIVVLQLLVGAVSIDVMAAVRAYVTGESLYSKGQKDGQLHLINYAESHSEEEYVRFKEALRFPIGDRIARVALQQPVPDRDTARRGLLQGGTPDEDIPGVIRLFRVFHETPLMRDAVATWTEGDALVAQLDALMDAAHAEIGRGNLDSPAVVGLRGQADGINRSLTALEERFAKELSDSARSTQRILLLVNAALASLLGVSGWLFIRRSARIQEATEQEVRRRQKSLQRLLDSAAEGLYGVDINGLCTFINRAALAMLGYDRESDLRGRNVYQLLHKGAATATKIELAQNAAELQLLRRDGTTVEVQYWSHPIAEGGRILGAVASFFDISARKALERESRAMELALRENEIRMAAVVEAVNDAVVTIDADQNVVLFNGAAERLFGAPARDVLGRDVRQLIPAVPNARHPDADRRNASVGSVVELVGVRPDGQALDLEASVSRVSTHAGPLLTVVLRDAKDLHTARAEREAREALEASNRAKTDFLSRMSHELRTPLNAVLGFARLLRMDTAAALSARQSQRVSQIEQAGSHLLALVNDVLDLSRVESGNMSVRLEPIDLRAAVQEAVSIVDAITVRHQVRVVIAGRPDDLFLPTQSSSQTIGVLADRVRLNQVLVNLLTNGIKYNRRGGQVTVSWEVCESTVETRIEDDGPGIAADKLQELFQPFNRLGAEHSGVEGTGIGLVLTKRLVELMSGALRIDSVVGEGCDACFSLRKVELEEQAFSASSPSQHGALDERLRVLYAEDNEVNVEIVKGVMQLRPSVDLAVATTGAAAFRKAKNEQPHLMLVDMNLGDMSGIELAAALKSDPATASIPLVALSADALPEQISSALERGFEGYLTKPVDFVALLRVVDAAQQAM
jgi:PAS domain S-box-containing protein